MYENQTEEDVMLEQEADDLIGRALKELEEEAAAEDADVTEGNINTDRTGAGDGESSEIYTGPDPDKIIEVDPNDILIDPSIHRFRTWAAEDGSERLSPHQVSMPFLMDSILHGGQDIPCVVRQKEDGFFWLVDGERRLEAVKRLRQQGHVRLWLRVVVREFSDTQAVRVALRLNIHRESFTPTESARAVNIVEKEMGYEGPGATEKLAAYFDVSPATITQSKRLLLAPKEMLELVDAGEMSKTAALDAMTSPEAKRQEVLRVARELRDREEAERLKREKAGKKAGTLSGVSKPASPTVPAVPASAPVPAPAHADAPAPAVNVKAAESIEDPDVPADIDEEPMVGAGFGVGLELLDQTEDESGSGSRSVESPVQSEPADSMAEAEVDAIADADTDTPKKSTRKPKIEGRHVRKAQSIVPGAKTKPKAPKSNEMVEVIGGLDQNKHLVLSRLGTTYRLWARGKVELDALDRELRELESCVRAAYTGRQWEDKTRKEEVEEVEEDKPVSKKNTAKGKGTGAGAGTGAGKKPVGKGKRKK